MIYAVRVLAILFALAHIAAGAAALKSRKNTDTAAVMSAGAAVVAASVAVPALNWLAALLGGGFVCAAAWMNGRRAGQVHWLHHAVRAAAVLAIAAGYAIW